MKLLIVDGGDGLQPEMLQAPVFVQEGFTVMQSPGAGSSNGYALVVFWRARRGAAEQIAALLVALARCVATEPGAIHFLVHRDPADDHAFVLYELYRSEADFQYHRATEHFRTLVLERAVPLLERRDIHPCTPMLPPL